MVIHSTFLVKRILFCMCRDHVITSKLIIARRNRNGTFVVLDVPIFLHNSLNVDNISKPEDVSLNSFSLHCVTYHVTES